jgi:hypothetical protein
MSIADDDELFVKFDLSRNDFKEKKRVLFHDEFIFILSINLSLIVVVLFFNALSRSSFICCLLVNRLFVLTLISLLTPLCVSKFLILVFRYNKKR